MSFIKFGCFGDGDMYPVKEEADCQKWIKEQDVLEHLKELNRQIDDLDHIYKTELYHRLNCSCQRLSEIVNKLKEIKEKTKDK